MPSADDIEEIIDMAKLSKDFWGNEYLDVTEDLERTRKNERFRRDIGRTGSNLQDDLAQGTASGVAGAVGVGLGAVAVGSAAAGSRSFRYKLEAFLHFPFAIVISFAVLVVISGKIMGSVDDETSVRVALIRFALSFPIGIIWSLIYVQKRTKPKLRALR